MIKKERTAVNTMESKYIKKAMELHMCTPVVDAHSDLAGEVLLRHRHGETRVIEHRYLPHWQAAGFHLIVSSVYIENSIFFPKPCSKQSNDQYQPPKSQKNWTDHWENGTLCWEQGYENALAQIRAIRQEIDALPEILCLVTSSEDLRQVMEQKKIGILLYMEGLDCIGTDITKIHDLYLHGVRGASLTWSRPNLLATGCCTATQFVDIPGCITPLGMEAIDALCRHHMFLDISHLNNEGWEQIHRHPYFSNTSEGIRATHHAPPYIATHSDAYSVFPNYRNLTDHQMAALARQGGVIGCNACKYITGAENATEYIDSICKHIEYIVDALDPFHVGFGFDLCDSYTRGKYQTEQIETEDCLRNHKEALLLTARLLERGMPEQTVLRILGLNWLDYFSSVLMPDSSL